MLICRRRIDYFVFQHPGEVVWDEDCVQARGKRRIDVRLRAVADHPGSIDLAAVLGGEFAVRGIRLLGQDFDGCEVRCQAGSPELLPLLRVVAFGNEDATVTGRQF